KRRDLARSGELQCEAIDQVGICEKKKKTDDVVELRIESYELKSERIKQLSQGPRRWDKKQEIRPEQLRNGPDPSEIQVAEIVEGEIRQEGFGPPDRRCKMR